MSFLKRLFGYKITETPCVDSNVPEKPYVKKKQRINRIFISFSSKDMEIAEKTCDFLENHGLDCWFAPRDIQTGSGFANSIMEGIEKSDATLLIFSKYSAESRYVLNEIEYSFEMNYDVFSLAIDDTLPGGSMEFFLRRYPWVDARPYRLQNKNLTLEDVLMELLELIKS